MSIFAKVKSWLEQRKMERMQKLLTKHLQEREERRHLLEREILIFLRRKKKRRDLSPHQSLLLAQEHFADQLTEERMQLVRDRANKSVKVILRHA